VEAEVGPNRLKGRGSRKKKDKRHAHALSCQCHATNDCGEEALRWQFWLRLDSHIPNSRAAQGVMRRRGLFLGPLYV
jgi:hypothetical protein